MFKFRLQNLTSFNALLVAALLQSYTTNIQAQENSTISDIYSDVDMRVRLSMKQNSAACTAASCEENLAFDQRVQSTGRYLSKVAEKLYPQQQTLVQRMTFTVADKKDPGTASNNKGNIIVFRGVQSLQFSDDALSFIIAREMGHVLGGHHTTNTSTKLIISALASVIFPAAAIIGASSTAAQASTATSLVTSAASTATSFVGGEIAMAKMKPTQLQTADEIAHHLMEKAGWDMRSVNYVLMQAEEPKNAWMLDLEKSRIQLEQMILNEEKKTEATTDPTSQAITSTDSAQ
ncbi:MAG TPA: M48 family metalloprotease [Methylophilus sp.]|nr:M48 family metalloprotease [Methylophilus sp.]